MARTRKARSDRSGRARRAGEPPAHASGWTASLIGAAIVLATVCAYAPVAGNDFINSDDPIYVLDNEWVQQGINARSLGWALTASHAANWHPVTWLSHMLDWQLFGSDARGHHLVSLALHAVNALLLFLLLRRMTGRPWPAAFVGAAFALHPLHVESVAWVAERKDVLSTFFWLVTTHAWAGWIERRGSGRYAAALALFALGLMAKPMLVTLPFVLLLLDRWPLARLSRRGARKRAVLEKLPFFFLAAASCAITLGVQRAGGAVTSLQSLPIGLRIGNALVSYATYIGQTLWPDGLAVHYPIDPGLAAWKPAAALALLALATVAVLRYARRIPALAVGWLWYLGTLVPVIGLVQVGAQAHADRYTYVPQIGLWIVVAWGLAAALAGFPRARKGLAVMALAALAAWGVLTWRQVGFWRDSATLYRHALRVTRENSFVHYNLGVFLEQRREYDRALEHYREAARIVPDWADPVINEGSILVAQNRIDEALERFTRAVRLEPGHPVARLNLAATLELQGRTEQAVRAYREAIRLDPSMAKAHAGLALLLESAGDLDAARREARLALEHGYREEALERLAAEP